LGESGKLYTWGNNTDGQIGNGNTNAVFTPIQITAVDRYSKVASGDSFTLALDAEGHLWSWGANNAGQLGDGTTTDRSTPKLVGGDNVFTKIYASKNTGYAIDNEGELWAWGDNKDGQYGNGTTRNSTTPASVSTNRAWSQIAVSLENNTVLGIDREGWLYSWGSNANGLLGNGTDWRQLQADENARFQAMIEQIKAEDEQRKTNLINQCVDDAYATAHLAYEAEFKKLTKEKEAAEEAARKKEQEEAAKSKPTTSPSPSASASATPSASTAPSPSPSPSPTSVPVIPDPEDLKEPVWNDFVEECTKKVESTFEATDTSDMKPAVIKEPALKPVHTKPESVSKDYRVKDIAVGSENAFAVDVYDRLLSWGKDANGQTGLGLEDANSHTQVPVVIKEEVKDVDAGSKYGVAVADNSDLLVWGANTNGVLLSKPSDEAKLNKPTVKGSGYTAVTAGLTTVYGFRGESAFTWGGNTNGELGNGSNEGAVYAAYPIDKKLSVISPAAKGAVALGPNNQFMYWGLNGSGQFGNSQTSTTPVRAVSSNEVSTFTAVAAGPNYTTALASDGRVWGWGSNATKVLNPSSEVKNKLTPVVLRNEFQKAVALAAGKNVSAVTDGSTLNILANGANHSYDLANIVELAAGDDHIVARTKEGKVWNWSLNKNGVREGTKTQTLTQADERDYASIAAGGTVSGAVTTAGEAVIWGAGSEKLRLVKTEGSPVPNFTFSKLSIDNGYVLAVDNNKVLWGWGQNRYLVLGSESVNEHPTVLTSKIAKEGK
jgi:alpha-tubulin suppressor-like RCC1 family protein